MTDSTLSRLFSAFKHTSLVAGVDQCLRFASKIVLARLLLPEHFGLFGLALTVVESLKVLSNFGLRSRFISVGIPGSDDREKWLNSVWALEAIRGILLAALLAASAGTIASYFGDSRLFSILLILSLVPIVDGIRNVGLLEYEKGINYAKVATVEVAASIAGFATTVLLALITEDATALALGFVLQSLVATGLSFAAHPFRPRLRVELEIVRDCFHFGKHLFVAGILTYVTTQVDSAVVGKMLGPKVLGLYIAAYSLSMLPVTFLSRVVTRVALPYYSEAWNAGKREAAFDRWLHMMRTTGAVVCLISVGLWAGRDYWIPIVYGSGWSDATPIFTVLIFVGIFRGLTHTISPMLLTLERPDIDAKFKLAEAVVFVSVLIFAVPKNGAVGAAYAGLISYLLAFLGRLFFLGNQRFCSLREAFGVVFNIGLSLGLVIVLDVAVHKYVPSPLSIIGSPCAFIGVVLILNPKLRSDVIAGVAHICQQVRSQKVQEVL